MFTNVPFDLRIHGPLPDCWRFTELRPRALFPDREIVEPTGLGPPGRDLMPMHHTVIADNPVDGLPFYGQSRHSGIHRGHPPLRRRVGAEVVERIIIHPTSVPRRAPNGASSSCGRAPGTDHVGAGTPRSL